MIELKETLLTKIAKDEGLSIEYLRKGIADAA